MGRQAQAPPIGSCSYRDAGGIGLDLAWVALPRRGANRTPDEFRCGFTVGLDASNVRQEENMYLSLSRDFVSSYPEQVQRLLGWSAGANHMGWIEIDGQMVDPINLLRDVEPGELRSVGASRLG